MNPTLLWPVISMQVELGRKPASFYEDPIGLMVECHRRIERFLYLLITIKRQAQGGELQFEQKAALRSAFEYFRTAAHWHSMDEEESLFPRLRLARRSDLRELTEYLMGLELEHAIIHVTHRKVEHLGIQWLEEGQLSQINLQCFSELLSKLSIIYNRHIHDEETVVFPLAERLLPELEIRQIGREMAARREVSFVYEMMASV